MGYDYSGWMEKKADESKEWALKTLSHIFDEADKSSGLTSDALDDVKDCWTILAMVEAYEHHREDEIAARVTGQPVK